MRPIFAAASCWPSSGPELTNVAAEQQRQLTFALVGGGATAEIARRTLARDFRRIDPGSARVILLEAGPRILPALASDLSDYTMRALTKIDAEVRTSSRVTACDRRGVDLDGGRINAGTAIWAAGVQASPAAR
jgi:NADH dehydrogenase